MFGFYNCAGTSRRRLTTGKFVEIRSTAGSLPVLYGAEGTSKAARNVAWFGLPPFNVDFGQLLLTARDTPLPQLERDHRIPDELRLTAVGRVAAGLVHDANNALAVVIWSLERAAHAPPVGNKEAESAKSAMASALKAAALLQRLLEYSSHVAYDPSLVNLDEILARLFVKASAAVEGDIRVDCQVGNDVGPVVVDEILLELGLLDLVAGLSPQMVKNGSILMKAFDLPPGEAPPPEAPKATVLLSAECIGLANARLPSEQVAILQRLAKLAGGSLTISVAGDRCEIRLYLPRAVASSVDGDAFV